MDTLWAPILEKAIAKIKGNYDNLNNGHSENMLRMLTGAPVMTYDLRDLTFERVQFILYEA